MDITTSYVDIYIYTLHICIYLSIYLYISIDHLEVFPISYTPSFTYLYPYIYVVLVDDNPVNSKLLLHGFRKNIKARWRWPAINGWWYKRPGKPTKNDAKSWDFKADFMELYSDSMGYSWDIPGLVNVYSLRTGKIHHAMKMGKSTISSWAIASSSQPVTVITRGYTLLILHGSADFPALPAELPVMNTRISSTYGEMHWLR